MAAERSYVATSLARDSFPDFDRVSDVIGMPMRDQNQIDALQGCDFIFTFRKNWIRQPRIDQKDIARGRDDFESRLPVPSELCSRHACHEIENTNRSKYLVIVRDSVDAGEYARIDEFDGSPTLPLYQQKIACSSRHVRNIDM